MKTILLIILFLISSVSKADTYNLPKELKYLAHKVMMSHESLKMNIRIRYTELLRKKELTLAEMQEIQAYKTIMRDYWFNEEKTFLLID